MTKLDEALGLFPSVIKCGEQWSLVCQAVLDEAKSELAVLRAKAAKHDKCSSQIDCLSRDGIEQPDWNYTSQPGKRGGPSTKD